MKISADTQKAISLILIYMALLFSLIGAAARMKSQFHARLEISRAGFVAAAILATLGVITLLFSFTRKRD
jgi:predicted permease